MEKMKKAPPQDQGRLKLLSREVHKTVETAIRRFSVRRSLGMQENERLDDDESGDSDGSNSLEFLEVSSPNAGPQIPTEQRLLLSQILQKMAGLWREKKQAKCLLLEKWKNAAQKQKHQQNSCFTHGCVLLAKVVDRRKFAHGSRLLRGLTSGDEQAAPAPDTRDAGSPGPTQVCSSRSSCGCRKASRKTSGWLQSSPSRRAA